jgi:hypothetical protein
VEGTESRKGDRGLFRKQRAIVRTEGHKGSRRPKSEQKGVEGIEGNREDKLL